MAWTTPKTDFGAETLTAGQMNAIGNNLEYLFAPNSSYFFPSSNYSTSSVSYVSIDATLGNFKHQIDTDGGNALVFGTLMFSNSGSGTNTLFIIEVDGVPITLSSHTFIIHQITGGQISLYSFMYPVEGLSDGNHTFELTWRIGGGTATIYGSAYQSFFGVARMG